MTDSKSFDETKFQRLWKTKNKDDEWWSSFITAPIGILLNVIVVDWSILNPNRLTTLSFIISLFGAAFILPYAYQNFFIAAILIQLGHVLDCMDGQMARYRGILSPAGSFYDKIADFIKIFLFFAAVSFTSFEETQDIAVVFLGFTATFFYTLRSYIKYVTLSIRAENDLEYFKNGLNTDVELSAGPSFSLRKNLLWFLREQRKFFQFDEGVFVFLISAALLLHELLPLLWILAISQLYYGLMKALQRGLQIQKSKYREMSHHFKK
ncbi:MAG TPA: CDP-alcohol phosphatidyltransferase family protein [Candidatus Marinimicrobia bacterium]|jgi:phosphatidylglycerophosphate synthase|nr:CDP-alcohol phosphatidyltransferase family protein [Candidatus Neomarinimicrobiota bacterium]|tara:strand:- start:784 stop:1581 length:798 start_codon:yes stop_codon:yes gene_type:complete